MLVHRCRFLEWQPSGVAALAFSPSEQSLAVARQNGDIELWNTSDWHIRKIIPGIQGNDVRVLVWCRQISSPDDDDDDEEVEERLFSSGLNAEIIEWDLETLSPKMKTSSYGGSVHAMAISPAGERLVAGCEDGTIRVFDIADGGLEYSRAFSAKSERVVSLAYHIDGHDLFAGYADGMIRRWNVRNAVTMYRITVERLAGERATVVWALTVLKDFTIVTGDSVGRTQFWDGKTGTLVQTFDQHQADVLVLATNSHQNKIFSTGVDAKVALFQYLEQEDGSRKWVYTTSQRGHTHDVRAMTASSTHIVTGSIDTRLGRSSIADFVSVRPTMLSSFPQRSVVKVAKKARLLLCQHSSRVEIWRLGKAKVANMEKDEAKAKLDLVPRCIANIELNPRSTLTASAISQDGSLIAISDISELRLFRLSLGATPTLEKVPVGDLPAAYTLTFASDCVLLIAAALNGDVHIYDTTTSAILHTFNHKDTTRALITTLAVSPDGSWLAAGSDANIVHVYNLRRLEYHMTLPAFTSDITSFDFHPSETLLVVTYASQEFLLYQVEKKTLSEWSKENGRSVPEVKQRSEMLLSVSFADNNEACMLLSGESYIVMINLAKALPKSSSEGQKRKKVQQDSVMSTQRFKPLLAAFCLGANELVAVERSWLKVAQHFPDILTR